MPQAGEDEPEGATEQIGRPESAPAARRRSRRPIKPKPEPPKLPDPNPGEPDPIPKKLVDLRDQTVDEQDNPTDESDERDRPGPRASPASRRASAPRRRGLQRVKPASRARAATRSTRSTRTASSPKSSASRCSSCRMIEQDGVLLAGTGSDGLIYQINPTARGDDHPREGRAQAGDDAVAVKGRIMLGMANTGGIAAMTSGFATEGTYTSSVLDAGQVSRFGKMRLHGSLPQGTTMKVSTRSGNVGEPADIGWSKWTDPSARREFVPVTSPAARFLQYRFTFTSERRDQVRRRR